MNVSDNIYTYKIPKLKHQTAKSKPDSTHTLDDSLSSPTNPPE